MFKNNNYVSSAEIEFYKNNTYKCNESAKVILEISGTEGIWNVVDGSYNFV